MLYDKDRGIQWIPDDSMQRLVNVIERARIDRQIILLYLEDDSTESIGDIVGLSVRIGCEA